jgi:hypothetical protein
LKGSSIINQIAIYGPIGLESIDFTPGARRLPILWANSDENAYLFGGYGYGSSLSLGARFLNDIWYFQYFQFFLEMVERIFKH